MASPQPRPATSHVRMLSTWSSPRARATTAPHPASQRQVRTAGLAVRDRDTSGQPWRPGADISFLVPPVTPSPTQYTGLPQRPFDLSVRAAAIQPKPPANPAGRSGGASPRVRGGGESRRRPATACSGAGASAGASRGWSPRGSRGGHQDRPATAANDGDEMHYEKRPNWYGSYSTKGLSSMAAVSPRIIDRQAVLSRMEAERLATEQRAKRRPARKGRGASKMKAAGRAMPRQRTIRERRVTGGGGGGGGGDSSATGSATTTGWAEEDDHNTQARGNSNLGTSTPEDQTGVWGPDNWVPTVPPEGEYPVLVTWWDRREAVARMSAKAAEAARARKRMQKAERRKRAAEGEAAERAAESREFAERRAALARHARAVEAFEEYDEDGSGAISFAEFCCVLCTAVGRELGIFELRLLFNQIDQDRSGEINYGEFIEWWSTIDDLEDLLKFTERQAYSYNDTNDDMVLSFLEFKDLLRIFLGMRIGKNKLRRLFISLDLNGDGCVNRREFYAWFERERAAQAAARKAKIAKVAAAKAAAAAAAAAGSPGQDARSPGAPPDFGDEHSSSSSSSMASRKGRKAGRPVPNYGGLAGDSSAVRPPPRRRSSIDMRAAAAAIQVAALRKARAAGPAPPKLDRPWTAFHTSPRGCEPNQRAMFDDILAVRQLQ